MKSIALENVLYSYKTKAKPVTVLKGLSYRFEQGKLYAIRGASGSGKTTLLSLLAGLDTPQTGSIAYDGVSTAQMDGSALRRKTVSIVFQHYNLLPLMTALENIMLPITMNGVSERDAKAKAREWMRVVGLPDEYATRFPAKLSGGEQQRVAIARALAAGTDVLLADEPTGNLDEENSKGVISLLQSFAYTNGKFAIVVTHDAAVMEAADAVLTMQGGELLTGVNA